MKKDKYKNFQVKRVVELPEIQCTLTELEHVPCGAKVLHLANDDIENVFCLSFQTTPDSSNGVAHILEHTVLCGSEKFPVKDPFFAMTRRSLTTFMNAFTGSDFTCYPAASQVPKDFYNLLEVYLDAVFRPNLRELSFLQEGHRVELTDPNDLNSPLTFKGIVFNEMKGAMGSGDSRLTEALNALLFPDVTYGVNSGGDPKEIPNLTYQQLLDFHRKHYHPSRCLFFFYGNLPLEGHLDFIENNALKNIERLPVLPPIPSQSRFTTKKNAIIGYPFSSDDDPKEKSLIAFGWLTCHILEQEELLALTVLSIILFGNDAAPVNKALLKSGLCKQTSAYLVDDYHDVPIVITMKGCEAENVEGLEEVIKKSLKELVGKGIAPDQIENAIHQIEFSRVEIQGDSYPFGLSLFLRAGLLEQHGGHAEDALMIHTLCQRLRDLPPSYYSELIKKYLLDNPHAVSVVAKPDPGLEEVELNDEKKVLENLAKQLDEGKKRMIIEKTQELADFQEMQEHADLDVLPKIEIKDVPKKSRDFVLSRETLDHLDVFHHDCFTNGIVYAELVYPLPMIRENELPLLRLFSFLLPQIGCGGRTYEENLDYIQAHTGSVGASECLNIQVDDFNQFQPYFIVGSKALHRKADKMFSLIKDMVTTPDFTDRDRLKEIIIKHHTAQQNYLQQKALKYALMLAASGLDVASRISNAWNGLEYYYFIKDIAENFDAKIEKLIEQLQDLKARILCLETPHLVITCDEEMYQTLKSKRFYGLQEIPVQPFSPWKNHFKVPFIPAQGRVIPSSVAFTAKVFKCIPYVHPDSPLLSIAANLFDNLTLHPRIREQGGAYGGGAINHAINGSFSFFAYRDPNMTSTFSAFDESVQRILNNDFNDSDLDEAKLGVIQGMDSPIAPGSRGKVAYTWLREGKTLQVRQTYRDRLLEAEREEVVRAVRLHISPHLQDANTVVFAGKELLTRENTILQSQGKSPLKIEKV